MHKCFQWNLQGHPSWALTDTLTPSGVLQVKEKQHLPSDRLERWRRMWNPEASHWPCTWLAPGNGPGIPQRWWQSLWKQEDGWLLLPKWKKEVLVWHWVYIQYLNRQSIIKTVIFVKSNDFEISHKILLFCNNMNKNKKYVLNMVFFLICFF